MSNESNSLQLSLASASGKLLRLVLAAVSAGFILLFLFTALRRLHYPYAMEQAEGGMFTSVWRLAHGLPLYTAPTPDFVPFLYTPLFYYIAAAATKLTGVNFAALRLVSVLATLGSFGLIFAFVYRETRNRLAALAGAGLYAACYLPTQGWFDIGRVDSLFIFFFLLAIYLTRRGPILLAVLAWVLAFQTKQGVLPIAMLIFCSEITRPRRMLLGMGSLIAGLGGSALLLNHLTSGWYNFYVFGSTRGIGWLWRQFIFYVPIDYFLPLGLAVTILLIAAIFTPPSFRGRGAHFAALASFAIYASIWYLRSHGGSSQNTMMPAYAWTAILFGIALGRLTGWLDRQPNLYAQAASAVLLAVASMQLLAHIYQPGRFIPAAPIRQARQALIGQIRAIPGPVFDISHSEDPIWAGKQPNAEVDSFGLITQGPPTAGRTQFMQQLQQAVDTHHYAAILADGPLTRHDLDFAGVPVSILTEYPVSLHAAGRDVPDITSTSPHEAMIYLPCTALQQDLSAILQPGDRIDPGTCPAAANLQQYPATARP